MDLPHCDERGFENIRQKAKDGDCTDRGCAVRDNPNGTAGLPKNGTYVTLKATTDGKMRVAVWINKGNRDVYIAKASDCKALSFGTEVIASGYINGMNNDVEEGSPLKGYPKYQVNIATKGTEGSDAYVIGAGNQAVWVYLTFIAKANETYYIFNKNNSHLFFN